MMPLTLVDVDEDNIIKKIGGKPEVKKHLENLGFVVVGHVKIISKLGGKPEVKKHLENLGFVVGGHVKIISKLGGNVIVNVKETRVAISNELAQKIMI